MNRREFLSQTAMMSLAAVLHGWADEPPLAANGERIRKGIGELSVFGRPVGGAFADGVSPTAYSGAGVGGRKDGMPLMRDAELGPHIDFAGNNFARRPGTVSGLKPILFGSHIDS